jgi:hypothetical protein
MADKKKTGGQGAKKPQAQGTQPKTGKGTGGKMKGTGGNKK